MYRSYIHFQKSGFRARLQLCCCSSSQNDADFPLEELATLSRPRQRCWDASAQSDALFMRSGPSLSGPQLPYHTHRDTKCNHHHAHTHTHAQTHTHVHTHTLRDIQDGCMHVNAPPEMHTAQTTHALLPWNEHTNISSNHYLQSPQT